MFASVIYNRTVTTSNTELIINSVVILFITDTDEKLFGVLMAMNPLWVDNMSRQINEKCDDNDNDVDIGMEGLKRKNLALQSGMNDMKTQIDKLVQEMNDMKEMMETKGFKCTPRSPSRRLSGRSAKREMSSFILEGSAGGTSYNAMDPNASDEKEELSGYNETL
eukprot:CAMPEP_0183787800 /NCGR_PEP_ID=MMETSP0739-20130205/67730_1 /TAXON_ID=385413 /ORGANISM="Thalassiosira miniscula, Strain CCMP1093" /LENGTH=164 /DNA_ID=CAMNT_0026031893 /DNA_START=439 /DNA_END=933 /DNA_ORIENTATION=+